MVAESEPNSCVRCLLHGAVPAQRRRPSRVPVVVASGHCCVVFIMRRLQGLVVPFLCISHLLYVCTRCAVRAFRPCARVAACCGVLSAALSRGAHIARALESQTTALLAQARHGMPGAF